MSSLSPLDVLIHCGLISPSPTACILPMGTYFGQMRPRRLPSAFHRSRLMTHLLFPCYSAFSRDASAFSSFFFPSVRLPSPFRRLGLYVYEEKLPRFSFPLPSRFPPKPFFLPATLSPKRLLFLTRINQPSENCRTFSSHFFFFCVFTHDLFLPLCSVFNVFLPEEVGIFGK